MSSGSRLLLHIGHLISGNDATSFSYSISFNISLYLFFSQETNYQGLARKCLSGHSTPVSLRQMNDCLALPMMRSMIALELEVLSLPLQIFKKTSHYIENTINLNMRGLPFDENGFDEPRVKGVATVTFAPEWLWLCVEPPSEFENVLGRSVLVLAPIIII